MIYNYCIVEGHWGDTIYRPLFSETNYSSDEFKKIVDTCFKETGYKTYDGLDDLIELLCENYDFFTMGFLKYHVEDRVTKKTNCFI